MDVRGMRVGLPCVAWIDDAVDYLHILALGFLGGSMSSLLNAVTRGRQSMPPRIVIYGTEGIGKSTFAANAPNPIFVQTENGANQIDVDKFPLAMTFEDVIRYLTTLLHEKHDYQTVVIDSLDWMERLLFDALCREYDVTSIEKVDGGYAKGYTHALTRWRQVLGILDKLWADRGMTVICIAHAKIERFEDPESTAYDRYTPRLHKHACGLVCEWSDATLFASRKMRVKTEDGGFRRRGLASPIGKDGGDRVIRCIGGPACVAKNRYGLPEEIALSWQAFVDAYMAANATKKEGVTNV